MSDRTALFLTGWRRITTEAEADALPTGAIAVVDDADLWDADTKSGEPVPELRPDYWDGVVDVQQRDFIHDCVRGDCSPCGFAWFEPDSTKRLDRPNLPFFAWHPTFCDLTTPRTGSERAAPRRTSRTPRMRPGQTASVRTS